jgi:RHS repeat-associated protein
LTSVKFKDAAGVVTKSIEYTYDSSDRRISKKVDGTVTDRYVYDGANIALVFDGAGVQTHRYLYGAGVDQILASERGGSVVWALVDNLGTVRDVVDGGGVVLNHVSYDSYGRVVSQTNPSVEFRFGYTGREQDSETGLDYYRARYYDAGVGRFISEDPIGFNGGDANLYRYVFNSPVNAIDPSGLNGEVTSYNRRILYSRTGDIIPSRIISVFPFGFVIPIPFQLRAKLDPFSEEYPTVHPVNSDPKIPFKTKSTKAGRIFSDLTEAEIKYTDTELPGKTAEPWGGKYFPDDNGHIIPNVLGGSEQRYNFFSQTRKINQGGYNSYGVLINKYLTKLENQFKKCGGEPPKLNLKVDLRHFYGIGEDDKTVHGKYPLRPNRVETEARFSDGAVSRGWFSNKVNVLSIRGFTYNYNDI